MSKLHCKCSEVQSVENVFFSWINRTFYVVFGHCAKKVDLSIEKSRQVSQDCVLRVQSLFMENTSFEAIFLLSPINEKALPFCLINFRQCIQSSSIQIRRTQLQIHFLRLYFFSINFGQWLKIFRCFGEQFLVKFSELKSMRHHDTKFDSNQFFDTFYHELLILSKKF